MSSEIHKSPFKSDSLYPEILQHGDLGRVLDHRFAQIGSPLRVNFFPERGPVFASAQWENRKCQIFIAKDERRFIFDCWQQGVCLANNSTASIEDFVQAIHHYLVLQGNLLEMQKTWPFVQPYEKAAYFFEEPAAYTRLQWRNLIQYWGREETGYKVVPILKAAQQHPKLSLLYPYTSMWCVCFSRCTGYPFDNPCPHIIFTSDANYAAISANWRIREGTLFKGDLASIIEFVAAQLPPDIGPAVHGNIDDFND